MYHNDIPFYSLLFLLYGDRIFFFAYLILSTLGQIFFCFMLCLLDLFVYFNMSVVRRVFLNILVVVSHLRLSALEAVVHMYWMGLFERLALV